MNKPFAGSIVLLAAIASPDALAQRGPACVETSADGRVTASVCNDEPLLPSAPPSPAAAGLASTVPFGTTPDWQNNSRRPVGGLQIADMNGDGRNDLIAGCFQSNSFPPYPDWRNFIHYNTGTALELDPSWYSSDQLHTGEVQIADFNLDSFPDILAVNGGFSHSPSVIYFGTATGPNTVPGWQSTGINAWALAAAVFDFDHDGDPDILTTNQSGITNDNFRPLYLFRNNASTGGSLQTSPAWQSQDQMISNGVDVGDIDGDGWEDIATAKWVNFQSGIYKNNFAASSNFSRLPIWTNGDSSGGRGAGFSDVDGDGDLDLAFGMDPTVIYRNDGGNTWTPTWASTAASPGVQELRWYDIDMDGDKDLAEINFSTGRLHIYLNNAGTINTNPDWTYDSTQVGNALAFGDINGDGCPDLAIGFSGDHPIAVFYNNNCNTCPADITGDRNVNVNDLLATINAWGACPAPPAACGSDIAPKGGDGQVNVNDLLAIINAWGACP